MKRKFIIALIFTYIFSFSPIMMAFEQGSKNKNKNKTKEYIYEFEAPTKMVTVKTSFLYPAPAMYDLDKDGNQELYVGDIWGNIQIFEMAGKKSTKWIDRGRLKDIKGKDLNFKNW